MGRVSTQKFLSLLTLVLFSIALHAQVQVTVFGTNVSCFGGSDGTATAIGSGGWAPYTYEWSNGATTATITGLTAGTYTVTATDVDLGFAIGSITITEPPQLGVTVFGESQICDIVPDGIATAVPFGGTPPYTYLWSNGGTTAQITGLDEGLYTVTVTDANECTTSGSAYVYFWDEGVWITPSSIDVTCFGANNGGACIMPMSGTPPYQYLWSTGADTPCISNLGPGVYSVTVTDANGCSNFVDIPITEPDDLVVTVTSTPGLCVSNGSITVTVSGGTPNYSILWNTGATDFVINVPPGIYTATITDANGCAKNIEVTVGGSVGNITVVGSVQSPAGCVQGGVATVTASGGSGDYAYSWCNGQNTQVATNLVAGDCSVTVTDIVSGCTAVATVSIPSATQLAVSADVLSPANCLTGGSAQVTAFGGVPPYTYQWCNGQTGSIATNILAGPCGVTVTDATGCVAVAVVIIPQSQGPDVTATVTQQPGCGPASGGSAMVEATGGTAPYTYIWCDGQTTQTATNLPAGACGVTVTDAGGCAATASVTLVVPNSPTVTASVTTAATCATGGSATASATDGTPPYAFAWSNGQTDTTATGLTPGVYTVTVTDDAGCTATASVTIAQPINPNVVITASSNAICDQPGSATASASGGTAPYAYLWSNGETTMTAVNLPAGTYTVTVTDAGGCTATATVTIGLVGNGISLGDYVWYDDDQDGFQHPLEVNGVPNITVQLFRAGPDGIFYNPDDILVQSTTTDADGKYLFTCVTPGTYVIRFSGIPTGYQFSGKDKVNNDCKDSDARPDGYTDSFNVLAGQGDNLCIDAGIHIFCINVTHAGLICCNQTICEGETPAILTTLMPPSGGVGALEYQWLQLVQVGQSPPNWAAIPGAVFETYSPGPLSQTSYFMRCARREGCITFLESNIITITVKPAGSPGCSPFLKKFDVQVTDPGEVMISWETNPELLQYLYFVQHSMDGQNWENIAAVMGEFKQNSPSSYMVMDQTPMRGLNLYRIRRIDIANVEAYSEVREAMVETAVTNSVNIFPNPVKDLLYIRNMYAMEEDVTIDIFQPNGVPVHTIHIKAGQLTNIELPTADLSAGLYMARINFGNGEIKTIKLTKF